MCLSTVPIFVSNMRTREREPKVDPNEGVAQDKLAT